MLASCSDEQTRQRPIARAKLNNDQLLAGYPLEFSARAGEHYLLTIKHHGADVALCGMSTEEAGLYRHDLKDSLTGIESVLLSPAVDTVYHTNIFADALAHYATAELLVEKLASDSGRDRRRLKAEADLSAATVDMEAATDYPAAVKRCPPQNLAQHHAHWLQQQQQRVEHSAAQLWGDRLQSLEIACQELDDLELPAVGSWCWFVLGNQSYRYLADWSKTVEIMTALKPRFEEPGDSLHLAQAMLFEALALMEHQEQLAPEKLATQRRLATTLLNSVLAIQQSADQPTVGTQSWTINNAGVLSYYLENYETAVRQFEQAAQMARTAGIARYENQARINEQTTRKILGSRLEARITSLEGLVSDPQNVSASTLGETYADLGFAYLQAGRWGKALANFHAALERQPLSQASVRSKTLAGLARTYFHVGNLTRARSYTRQAEALFPSIEEPFARIAVLEMSAELAEIEGRRGDALTRQDLLLAEANSTETTVKAQLAKMRLFLALGEQQNAAETLQIIAELLPRVEKESFREQARLLQLELVLQLPGNGQTAAAIDFSAAQIDGLSPAARIQFYLLDSKRYLAAHDWQQAIVQSGKMVELIWESHSAVNAQEYTLGYLDTQNKALSYHIELLLQYSTSLAAAGEQAAAEEFSIQALAYSELLRWSLPAKQSAASRARLHRKAAQLPLLSERLLETPAGNPEALRLAVQIETVQREIDLLESEIAGVELELVLANAAQLQRVVPVNTTIVEYWLGEQLSVAWLVSRDGIRTVMLESGTDIAVLARKSWQSLSRPGFGSHQRELTDLAARVLVPIVDQLETARVAFVSHGALQLVPMSALPIDSVANTLLLDLYDVYYAPSILAFRDQPQPSPAIASRNLLYAPGQFSSASQSTDQLHNSLPGTLREVEAISALLPAEQVTLRGGVAATRENFLQDSRDSYRFIHIASHAVQNTEVPRASSIIFSKHRDDTAAVLLPYDIEQLELHTELVVLSACETSLGRVFNFAGVQGLQWSFLRAGSRAVLGSSWAADDDLAATLMTRFYQMMLVEGLDAVAALNQAQRELRAGGGELSAPYYWSGWMLQSIGQHTGIVL